MAAAELHGQKITPFEQGYAAFLRGVSLEHNPFEAAPFSKQRWVDGWNKAQCEAWRKV